jgi:hypothetical protein
MCLKRRLVDVFVTHSNLPEARGEVEVGVTVRVLKLIERVVVNTRKWVSIFTRNLVKATVVNAQTERAINLTHKKNWRAELIVAGTDQTSLHGVFELSIELSALCKRQSVQPLTSHRASCFNGMIPLSAYGRRVNMLQ